MIKSFSKRIFVFLLFISFPWAATCSKSQKNSTQNRSHKNESIKSHIQSQVSIKDTEERSPKIRTSQMSPDQNSPSQKITKSHVSKKSSHSSSSSSSTKSRDRISKNSKSQVKSSQSINHSLSRQVIQTTQELKSNPSHVSHNSPTQKSSHALVETRSPQKSNLIKDTESHRTSEDSRSHQISPKKIETRSPEKSNLSLDRESHRTSENNLSHQTSPKRIEVKQNSSQSSSHKRSMESHSRRSHETPSHVSSQNNSIGSGQVEQRVFLKAERSNRVGFSSNKDIVEIHKSVTSDQNRSPIDRTSHRSRSHKSMDYGQDIVNKSRSKYEKLGENEEEHVCKKNLMTIFSVEGNHLDQAVKATPREKSFCRRNGYTCCSAYNIESITQYYGLGKRKLRLKFEILEELFALFRGPKFLDYVLERKDMAKCAPIVQDMSVRIKGHDFNFFTMGYLRYQLEMAENLLMDTEIYVKKILWFYGDSICAICSPKVQDYFDFSDSNPKVHMHINTCSERIEEREYERSLVLLYEHFVSKTIEWIQCTEGVAEAEENGGDPDGKSEKSGEDEEGHEDVLLPIDEDEKKKFLETFDECWNDQNVSKEECKEFCMKNMRKYEFPVHNLFHNFKVSLKVMFGAMTGGNDIGEYYENIKELDWKIEDENDPIDFYPESEDWTKYKMDELKWEFHTSTGHNVFKEIMSKKFTDFEMSVSRFAVVFFVSLFALLK